VLAVIVWLWVTGRRYRGIGGREGLILDIATLAVPLGLIGARAYGVLTNYHLYFGHHRDWANVLRLWDGRFGLGPPRVFRTARLTLIHAASCRFRYSSWTSCGVLYPSAEWRRVRLYRSSIYRAISSLAFFLVGYAVR
jgi:hypothetical protein